MFCSKTIQSICFRARFLVPLALFWIFPLPAQETILESYERIFIRSSLDTKVNVLSDAATDEAAPEFYGPLCNLALDFVINNADLFREDPDMLGITLSAVKGVGKYGYNPAAETLWQVFLRFPDRAIRYEILRTLPVLDAPKLLERINQFLEEQNSRYTSGLGLDPQLLTALFELLGSVGNDSSYPVLFVSKLIYSGDLETQARRALYNITGDFYGFCSNVILNNPPEEKMEAFRLAMGRETVSAEEQGTVAEAALEAALSVTGTARERFREISALALHYIRESGRVSALPLVIKYYNQTQAAFRSDASRRRELADAIACLSALRDTEAARTLGLQLGLYNARFDSLKPEEKEIVMALILALGGLGYKASYDTLYHASTLAYPNDIREAARNALTRLEW
ncbi:hypothetical protein AGMMS50230_19190 [Spirochaetia bacterium]|nr:hypothetical protein AGMMS50230_19190 [Spirochaetia bacterium]